MAEGDWPAPFDAYVALRQCRGFAMGLGSRCGQMLPKELFPVAAPNFDPVTAGSSHSSRRRRNVMSHKAAWQTDCVHTLNELSGCGDAPPPKVQNSAKAGCLDQLHDTFSHQFSKSSIDRHAAHAELVHEGTFTGHGVTRNPITVLDFGGHKLRGWTHQAWTD